MYWHSEVSGKKDRKYHYNKRKLCEEQGVRLITVFEDEYKDKPDVVISRINHAIGVTTTRIFARKCSVRRIESCVSEEFMRKNHLQGSSPNKVSFGIFYGDKLLGVMDGGLLTRAHVSKSRELEIKRLCFLPGYAVIGGASKLLSVFITYAAAEAFTHIRTYQDMRYGNPWASVYDSLGFTLVSETKYTPHYIKDGKRYRNYKFRKTPEERLTGKTEWELRRAQGLDRIWDCGHRTYIMNVTRN